MPLNVSKCFNLKWSDVPEVITMALEDCLKLGLMLLCIGYGHAAGCVNLLDDSDEKEESESKVSPAPAFVAKAVAERLKIRSTSRIRVSFPRCDGIGR